MAGKYLRPILWWLAIPTILGFLFAVLAVGPGGASAIFLFIGMFIGVCGAIVHCVLRAFLSGKRSEITGVIPLALLAAVSLFWLWSKGTRCEPFEQQASEQISAYLLKTDRALKYLGKPVFHRDQCAYIFSYDKKGEELEVIVFWGGRVGSMPVDRP